MQIEANADMPQKFLMRLAIPNAPRAGHHMLLHSRLLLKTDSCISRLKPRRRWRRLSSSCGQSRFSSWLQSTTPTTSPSPPGAAACLQQTHTRALCSDGSPMGLPSTRALLISSPRLRCSGCPAWAGRVSEPSTPGPAGQGGLLFFFLFFVGLRHDMSAFSTICQFPIVPQAAFRSLSPCLGHRTTLSCSVMLNPCLILTLAAGPLSPQLILIITGITGLRRILQ